MGPSFVFEIYLKVRNTSYVFLKPQTWKKREGGVSGGSVQRYMSGGSVTEVSGGSECDRDVSGEMRTII